ncbi:MAG: hypothetical protein LUC92_03525 [Clostridiales bacterium]|nr:hypothetical protein [Clostridiales bacterium]
MKKARAGRNRTLAKGFGDPNHTIRPPKKATTAVLAFCAYLPRSLQRILLFNFFRAVEKSQNIQKIKVENSDKSGIIKKIKQRKQK